MKAVQFIFLFLITIVSMTSCITGPVRRSTFGQYSYATVEWTKEAHPLIKPAAAIGGVISDIAITVADTVTVPLVSIPLAFYLGYLGPCPPTVDLKRHPIRDTIVRPIFSLIYFPICYPVCLYLMSHGGGLESDEEEDEKLKSEEDPEKADDKCEEREISSPKGSSTKFRQSQVTSPSLRSASRWNLTAG
jgi:hypothetical protein